LTYENLVASLVEPETRRQVADELRQALPDSCDALLAGLRHGPPSVRRWCAVVLDHAPHGERIENALVEAATDRNKKVRKAALHALSCARCKPDGCLTTDGVGTLVEAMLHDRSLGVRRNAAGALMWGQHGDAKAVNRSFRHILDRETDGELRKRAAWAVARQELPRGDRPFKEWIPEWMVRAAELAATGPGA
jgi:HEAT repeat protein